MEWTYIHTEAVYVGVISFIEIAHVAGFFQQERTGLHGFVGGLTRQLLSNWVSESTSIYWTLSWGWGETRHFNQNWASAQYLSGVSLQTLAGLMDSPPHLCYWAVISIQIGTYLVSLQSVPTDEAWKWSHLLNYLRCSVYVTWAISKSWPTVCSVTLEDSLFSKGNSPSCELTSLES